MARISELTQVNRLTNDIRIPVAVGGQNMMLTFGQIAEAQRKPVLQFASIIDGSDATYTNGSTGLSLPIVYDTATRRFYAMYRRAQNSAGQIEHITVLYDEWDGYETYFGADGEARTDCIFVATDGRLYISDGAGLRSAGLTDEMERRIGLSTPIEVASEEAMAEMVESGDAVDGQLYFIAEEE